jgi:hypothetical protein
VGDLVGDDRPFRPPGGRRKGQSRREECDEYREPGSIHVVRHCEVDERANDSIALKIRPMAQVSLEGAASVLGAGNVP